MADRLTTVSDRYRKSRENSRQLRDELDALIAASKADGQTFRAIATKIGMSVAWVQNSLQRTGKTSEGRVDFN